MLLKSVMLEPHALRTQVLFQNAQAYLSATLHATSPLKPWDGKRGLPLFLTNGFDFRLANLFGRQVLLTAPGSESAISPTDFVKQIRQLQRRFDGIIVLVLDNLSAYQRGKLIEEAVPFVVPGNQLFIPQLALDLKEQFRKKRSYAEDHLSPVSQALLLRHLNLREVQNARPSDLVNPLRYSAMSVGRAFEELQAGGLCRIEEEGREKRIKFDQAPRDLFQMSLPRLRSPVKAEHWYRAPSLPKGFFGSTMPDHLPAGGESALSERTSMAKPRVVSFATGPKDWKRLQSGEFGTTVDQHEDPDYAVDVWWYDPDIASDRKVADPLSLYLQFRDHSNERLQGAAEQLLEEFSW